MGLFVRARSLWRTIVRGQHLDTDLDDEVRAYVDLLVERRVAAGESPDAARRAVLIDIGGVEATKAHVRDGRLGRWLDDVIRDLGLAVRSVWRAPAFALAALTTLTVAVGAATAIFSIADSLLIQPLPYRDPDRLVFVWADQTAEGYPRAPLSGPELRDLDERASQFEGFGGIWSTTTSLTGEDDPEQLRIGLVTSDFFQLLGAEPALGRAFRTEDETAGPPTTILLGHAIWTRRYGSDPNVVGRRIDVNGRPTVVVGVMPARFRLLMPPDAAVPDDLEAWQLLDQRYAEGPRGQRYLRVIGRMRPGVGQADAVADVARIGRDISAAHAFYGAAGRRFDTIPLHVDAVRDVQRPLLALSAGVAILLLIACVNVGSLMVARAAARAKELAVQLALGAGRARLIRQQAVEALVLALLGAALGVGLSAWGLRVLQALTPASLSRIQLATVHWSVASIACAAVIAWMVSLALAQSHAYLRTMQMTALREDRRHTGSRTPHRIRAGMTVLQVALSVVLVVGALLLVRTVQRANAIDLGFEARGLLSFRVALPGTRYPNQDAFNAFARRLQAAIGDLPGASGASSASHAPYDHVPNWGGPYLAAEGGDHSTAPQADYRAVAPGAMELLGAQLKEGRWFTESDGPTSTPVALVDERLATRMWPGQSAVGRRLGVDPAVTGVPSVWTTVVGVVEHLKHRSPVEEVREQVYFPARQVTRNPSVYIVKATGDPTALVDPLRQAVRALDAALPIYDVRPLEAYVTDARALRRYTAQLAAIFAVAALGLAALGVFGVVAYTVTERQREFGVRMALGASARELVPLVLREGASLTAAGLAIGAGGAALAGWWLRAQLIGVTPWDPVVLSTTAGVLAATSVVACLGPLRRVLCADPAAVLREG